MMENIFDDLNKLFCTFTTHDDLESTLSTINRRYSILYNKIFVLESPQSKELMCTYNIDMGNVSEDPLPNTILLHRKKESNTLYTINALNALIRSLNNGMLDTRFIVNWADADRDADLDRARPHGADLPVHHDRSAGTGGRAEAVHGY